MTNEKRHILLGAHMSIAGGLEKAILRGEKVGCSAIQIFTKNNKAYFASALSDHEVTLFKETLKNSSIKYIMVHTSYLINIGASNEEVEKRSQQGLIHELERCEQLGIPYLVLHPGSHTGAGEEACIEKIAKNLDLTLQKVPGSCMILLETAAGQGSNIGYTFQQLNRIIERVRNKDRVGVCLDTCHIFVAGYDIRTKKGYEDMWASFSKELGLEKLKAIHLNDSKTEFGSKKDRHENLGKGTIPLEAFKWLMNDISLQKIPKILETPSEDGITEYTQEITLLKSLTNDG